MENTVSKLMATYPKVWSNEVHSLHMFYIHNTASLTTTSAQGSFHSDIIRECKDVQDEVWNSKYDIRHNTTDNPHLLLVTNNEKIIGFISAKTLANSENSISLYYSDFMFSHLCTGVNMISTCFNIFNKCIAQENKSKSEIINIVITGNLCLFYFFIKNKFKQTQTRTFHPEVNLLIKAEFPNCQENNGVIRNAWKRQDKQKKEDSDIWPKKLADKFHFPSDISYSAGDVFWANFIVQTSRYSNYV